MISCWYLYGSNNKERKLYLFSRNNGYAISTPTHEQYRGDGIGKNCYIFYLLSIQLHVVWVSQEAITVQNVCALLICTINQIIVTLECRPRKKPTANMKICCNKIGEST